MRCGGAVSSGSPPTWFRHSRGWVTPDAHGAAGTSRLSACPEVGDPARHRKARLGTRASRHWRIWLANWHPSSMRARRRAKLLTPDVGTPFPSDHLSGRLRAACPPRIGAPATPKSSFRRAAGHGRVLAQEVRQGLAAEDARRRDLHALHGLAPPGGWPLGAADRLAGASTCVGEPAAIEARGIGGEQHRATRTDSETQRHAMTDRPD